MHPRKEQTLATVTPSQAVLLASELLGELPADVEGRINDTPSRLRLGSFGRNVVTLRSGHAQLDPGGVVVAAVPGRRAELTLIVEAASKDGTSATARLLDFARLDERGERLATVLVLDRGLSDA